MSSSERPLILSIDDSRDTLNLIERFLASSGYDVITADSGLMGLEMVAKARPDLILLDVMMPKVDGYQICERLQKKEETAYIPVIFVTALEEEQNKARAFSVGAVDYLVKPIKKDILVDKVRAHMKTKARWEGLHDNLRPSDTGMVLPDFGAFKGFLVDRLDLSTEQRNNLASLSPSHIYGLSSQLGTTNAEVARYIAEFLSLPHVPYVNPEQVQLGVIPTPFCRSKSVVAVSDGSAEPAFILSNPFDWGLLENLKKSAGLSKTSKLMVSDPESIELLFRSGAEISPQAVGSAAGAMETVRPTAGAAAGLPESEVNTHPMVFITNNILNKAMSARASDIHIEPKETNSVVRFRIDGDLKEVFTLKKDTGVKLISRFKVLAGLDIAEKRKPQDGAFSTIINDTHFNVRVASTSTPQGESMIMRLLEPSIEPKELQELGMTDKQTDAMVRMINGSAGFLLITGATGSGKTTTIYSLLHKTDFETRSLMSVEDPVEYRIAFANQQQVNVKGGVTFEALLKSAVRQDPDILFMGEIRDSFSAKTAVDFASTGHLTISTLHTSNATTAIFRLERLGLDRGIMADTILGVVAQKLMRRLCPHCKEIVPISKKEIAMLSPFAHVLPEQVAHPVGCPKCDDMGYRGREGVYEVLEFDRDICEMVRASRPIAEIRAFARNRGNYLMSHHAVDKVKDFIVSPKDAYESVLIEDIKLKKPEPRQMASHAVPPERNKADGKSILVVDDDKDTRKLIGLILKNRGYRVTFSEDGIDALLSLDKKPFDLVLCDVNMPNLDGFKLLEMMNQKGLKAPVIFLTARDATGDKERGVELGAMDYIQKPIQKEILLLRVKGVLETLKKSGRVHAEPSGQKSGIVMDAA
jgi:type II secretory ATPase GspE/PulE/Tfp pilus assembly ATPase PilB-like protein/DNA-binding response OmpR family regulator